MVARSFGVMVIVSFFYYLTGVAVTPAAAQPSLVLEGTVYSSTDRQGVAFATVALLEAQIKTTSDINGAYTLSVPQPGTYTLYIFSPGLSPINITITLTKTVKRDFFMRPISLKGGTLVITGQRDVQKLSRYTMTSRQIKDVPATFGDAVGALTALPGVNRTGGFFGLLVIRGAETSSNRYFLDDIPMYDPQHFGGIHSVVSNEIIREIDLYASAFPAEFGGGNGAVININTIDKVDRLSGYADVGLISATTLVKVPLTSEQEVDGELKQKNNGYFIVAGRIGYLSLFIPPVYELFTGDKIDFVPEYWDYQLKIKYYLNNNLSLSLLAFGSSDYLVFINKETPPDTVDPLLQDFEFNTDVISMSQGIYLTYQPSPLFNNTFMCYAALTDSRNYINLVGAASWLEDYTVISKPYIYGIKNKTKWDYIEKIMQLRLGLEFTYYDFTIEGSNLIPDEYPGFGQPDFGNENEFRLEEAVETIRNKTIGGYAENKVTYKGLTFIPGVRAEYLDRSNKTVVDPRGLLSYEFPSETTISAAGGQYSYFFQTNPYVFDFASNLASKGSELKPEKAYHSAVGIEQVIQRLWTIRLEGFYNYFFDLYEASADLPNGFQNSGEQKAYGMEVMLRKDREENRDGMFGWINYTYTQSKRKRNVPLTVDEYGDTWTNFRYEQEHVLKLVAGYVFGKHTLSSRFQLYTSYPYTPVTGDDGGVAGRYAPRYDGVEPFSRHFPASHRMDVRYSYKTTYEWGFVSWYIEVINVYNYRPIDNEEWNYTKPYEKNVNPKRTREEGLNMIPNFGVEVKF